MEKLITESVRVRESISCKTKARKMNMGLFDNLQEKINLEAIQGKLKADANGGSFDSEIENAEKKLRDKLAELGEVFFQENAESCEEKYAPYIEAVKELLAEKDGLERAKLAAQGLRKCDFCGQTIPLDSMFCNKCGEKLEPVQSQRDLKGHCAKCGAAVMEGAAFCTVCGAPLSEKQTEK